MKTFALLYFFSVGCVAGYKIHEKGLDQRFLSQLNQAWENRIRRDAQIMREELTKGAIVNVS